MKVLIRKLAATLLQLSPLTITVIGLCFMPALGMMNYHAPGRISFIVLYMLLIVFVGWGAGKWPAVLASGVAVVTMTAVEWNWREGASTPGWAIVWNASMWFAVLGTVGWFTAEAIRLARYLSQLVEEHTAKWKLEAEEHKATSARLADALERFEQVIDNITEVFWLTDVTKQEIAYVSPAYERVWGRNCEDLYREPGAWLAAVHPADRDQVKRRSLTDQAAGRYDVEYRILRPDGDVRWIRDRAFPVRNKQGEVYRIAGLAEDITERKQTRELLRTQAAILENMAEGVVVTDAQGVIVQMNRAGERIWGYQPNEVLGQPTNLLSGLAEPEANAVMREVLAALQATGSWRGTIKHRRKDGKIIFCETVISRLEVQGRVLMVAVEQDVTERLRAQEQLQMQAQVLESMGEAVLVVDEAGTIILCNPALEALLGYERGELLGQPMLSVAGLSPEGHYREFQRILAAVKAHGSAASDYLARRKDGTLIEVETRSSGVAIGGRLCLVVVGQDITDRKRAEQALRQSEETLRVFLDAVPEPAFLLDRNGTILVGNRALARSLRLPEGDLIDRPVFGLIPASIAQTRKAMFDQVLRNREPVRFEDSRGGSDFLNLASPVLDAAGNVTRVAVVALDITERKQAESALARQEALYRTLFDLSPDGILLEDMDGNILDANQALCQSFGYSREELRRQNVRLFVAPEHQGEVAAHLATLRAGQTLEHEVWNIRKNGQRCLMKLTEKPLALPDGRRGILVVARDITASKRAELIREAFLSLGTKLSAARSPVEAARAIYASADLLWEWHAATLDVWSPAADQMQAVLNCDLLDGQRREVPANLTSGVATARMRRIMQAGPELILREPPYTPTPDSVMLGDLSRPSASIMCVPLRQDGQTVGVLSIQSYLPKAFTQEDLQTLQALGDYCGGALERIRTEQALQASEERYRSLVNNLTVGVFRNTPGPQGGFVQVNPALARMHGYDSVEEFQKVRVADLYQDPREREVFLTDLVREDIVLNYELRLKRKDGTALYGSVNATAHRGLDGEVDWIDGVLEDITERKQAEQRLAEALELNTKLVSASTVGIAAYKASGQCVVANDALARITGGTVERLLQQDFRRLESWRTDGLLARAEAALETGQAQELESQTRSSFGRELIVSARFTSFVSQREQHLLLMVTDESEAARAQEARRASEERYRTLAESSPDAIFILDRDIKVQYVNSAAAILWRRTPQELIGRTQPELFPPAVAQYHCQVVAEVFATGQPVRRDEPLTFPTGDRWIEIRLAPLSDAQGTVTAVMGICRDITERKRAERQLAEALDLNQKMIAASTVGIAAYKATGECVFANQALAQMVGGSMDGMLKNDFRRSEVWRKSGKLLLAEEVLTQGRARSGEFYGTSRFGRTCWQECHLATFTSGGQPHLLEVATEITERKRAESLLQAQRDLGVSFSLTSDLQAALECLLEIAMQVGGVDSGGIYLLDPATGGMDVAAHRGVSDSFFKAVSHWAPDSPQIRLMRQGRPVFTTYQDLPITHDNVRLAEGLRAVAHLPLCHEGSVIGALALASHLTDEIPRQTQLVIEAIAAQAAGAIARIRAVEALRQSEARLRAIIAGAPVVLFAVDHNGIIRFEDGQAVKALGATPAAHVGRPVEEVYADVPVILENSRRALRGEEFDSIVQAGQVTFDCRYSPTRDKDGNSIGFIGVATNITERHRLERQILEISDREQARIGQDIHDGLCQHLVSLAFDANTLQKELAARRRPEARIARRIAAFLDQAITESRQLSRGLFPVRLETEGLPPALEELARATSHRFKGRCRFGSRGPVPVESTATATHLYRIAQEAVANAVKHSRARSVTIRLRARAGSLELTIQDDGVGFSPAAQKKPTGLGLHIMDYRARAIGGTLRVGPGPQGGTLVSCCVPSRPS